MDKYNLLQLWLIEADENYVASKILSQSAYLKQSCSLGWLSIELITKTLIFQKHLPDLIKLKCTDNEIRDKFKKLARSYNHKFEKLIEAFSDCYPEFDMNRYNDSLKIMHEFYSSRYTERGKLRSGVGINLNDLANYHNEYFFALRNMVDQKVGPVLIDTIGFRQRIGSLQEPGDQFAYINNKHFSTRKYKERTLIIGGTDLIYTDNGIETSSRPDVWGLSNK
ncbi:MAG: hypothetical protein ACJAU8_000374 [Candidatus Paceibacteria bacterium]|jgi:hypothetical protein